MLGQLECITIEKWIMSVEMQRVKRLEYIELHRKLVIAYGYAEKDGLSVQYGPILLENTECIED